MRRNRGFTLIELMIVIAIIAIIAAIAIPNLLQARKNANEAAAVGALKTINSSQAVFREGDKERDGNLDYGFLTELSNVSLIDVVLGKGSKQGYYFSVCYSFATSEFLWFSVCNPQVAQVSADRYFATNVAGVIFYSSTSNLLLDTSTCTLLTSTGARRAAEATPRERPDPQVQPLFDVENPKEVGGPDRRCTSVLAGRTAEQTLRTDAAGFEPATGSGPRETADTSGGSAYLGGEQKPMEGTIVARRQRRTTERTRRWSKALQPAGSGSRDPDRGSG